MSEKQFEEEVGSDPEIESDVDDETLGIDNSDVSDREEVDSDLEDDTDDDDDDDDDIEEYTEMSSKKSQASAIDESSNIQFYDSDEDDEEEDLDKFNNNDIKQELISEHPEFISHNTKEVNALAKIIRDANGNIIDKLHRTVPFITRYEKAKILGERSKQLSYSDVEPMINVPPNVIDCYEIAKLEYNANAIPFIIKRNLPDGTCEYWRFQDLEKILFD